MRLVFSRQDIYVLKNVTVEYRKMLLSKKVKLNKQQDDAIYKFLNNAYSEPFIIRAETDVEKELALVERLILILTEYLDYNCQRNMLSNDDLWEFIEILEKAMVKEIDTKYDKETLEKIEKQFLVDNN